MITEREYLKALAIVRAYQKQINEQVDEVDNSEKCIGDLRMKQQFYWEMKRMLGDVAGNEIMDVKLDTFVKLVSKSDIIKFGRHIGPKTIASLDEQLKSFGFKLRS